jgi:hypothetical protein
MDKKIIEDIKKQKCCYPSVNDDGEPDCCNKPVMMSVSLPLVNQLENGKIESSDTGGVVVPLCDYHGMLAMSSGMIGVKSDDKMEKMQLLAPFDMIHMIESVVTSMAMTGKIQEIMDGKAKAEKMAKEMKGNEQNNKRPDET